MRVPHSNRAGHAGQAEPRVSGCGPSGWCSTYTSLTTDAAEKVFSDRWPCQPPQRHPGYLSQVYVLDGVAEPSPTYWYAEVHPDGQRFRISCRQGRYRELEIPSFARSRGFAANRNRNKLRERRFELVSEERAILRALYSRHNRRRYAPGHIAGSRSYLRSQLDYEVTFGALSGQDERCPRAAPLTAPQVTIGRLCQRRKTN